MRGPFERLKYDLRRLWECPVCQRRERTSGAVTFRHCSCRMQQLDGQPAVMRMIADGVQRLVPSVVIRHDTVEVASDAANSSAGQEMTEMQGPAENTGNPDKVDAEQ